MRLLLRRSYYFVYALSQRIKISRIKQRDRGVRNNPGDRQQAVFPGIARERARLLIPYHSRYPCRSLRAKLRGALGAVVRSRKAGSLTRLSAFPSHERKRESSRGRSVRSRARIMRRAFFCRLRLFNLMDEDLLCTCVMRRFVCGF